MRRSSVTLQDIATRTGVSKVTVSYILNNRQTRVRISDTTRQRVLDVAREMGYSPNAVARALARRRTDTVTLVMQSPHIFSGGSGFMTELMRGVLDAANALGYDVMLHTKPLPDVDAEVVALTDGRADGVLVLRDLDDPLAERLHDRGVPCVVVFARSLAADVCFVDCDNVVGGQMAAEYLVRLGHRRCGFVAGSGASSAVGDRCQGFQSALCAHGLAVDPRDAFPNIFSRGDFRPLLERMGQPDRPTALFAWSDDVAAGIIAALRNELGLRVPEDVSVIGFDDAEALCERNVPRLTSIGQPIAAIARRAMELLVARIQNGDSPEPNVLFPPTLAVRDSCTAPSFSKEGT